MTKAPTSYSLEAHKNIGGEPLGHWGGTLACQVRVSDMFGVAGYHQIQAAAEMWQKRAQARYPASVQEKAFPSPTTTCGPEAILKRLVGTRLPLLSFDPASSCLSARKEKLGRPTIFS